MLYRDTLFGVFFGPVQERSGHQEAGCCNHNTKLRNLLNTYQNRLDEIVNPELYSCKQLKDMIQYADKRDSATFKSISDEFLHQLIEEGRGSYAKMIEHNSRTFLDFCKGDIPI